MPEEDLTNVSKYLKEGFREDGAKIFSAVPFEAVEPPTLEILKRHLEMVLGIFYLKWLYLRQMTSRGPFQPEPYCDSVKYYDCNSYNRLVINKILIPCGP